MVSVSNRVAGFWIVALAAGWLGVVALVPPATGQEHDHMAIWSTEDGGGDLTVEWEFDEKKVQLFESFCSNGECLYTTPNPAFLAPVVDEDPDDGLYVIKDGTRLGVEVIAIDAGAVLNVNGNRLNEAGEAAVLGSTPGLHVHPSWQLTGPEGEYGEHQVMFKFKDEAAVYGDSDVYTAIMTNVPIVVPPTPTPTVTPTPQPGECVGDCDGDGSVTINELVLGVSMALDDHGVDGCPSFDKNGDDRVEINELVGAVRAILDGCGPRPTPTSRPVSFAEIQTNIFTPRCALPTCHDAQSHTGNLVLAEGSAYADLIRVEPDLFTARAVGLLLVEPRNPDNSFLLTKVAGVPRPDFGSRMPLTGDPLTEEQIQLIRDWIAQGASE